MPVGIIRIPMLKSVNPIWVGMMKIRQRWMLSIAASAFVYIAIMHGEQIGVFILKTFLVSWFAAIGYYIDRNMFDYARPHDLLRRMDAQVGSDRVVYERCFNAAQLRRAIIIAGTLLAGSLAL